MQYPVYEYINTDEEVIAAATLANADQFIRRLPHGYETELSERGSNLSQGQRQLLSIARAILADPRILILDDSTSAIDSATEDQIQRAMRRISRQRTTFLITHRLSQIRWADQIVVLRRGTVAAVGTHDQLMEQSQAYRDIFMVAVAGPIMALAVVLVLANVFGGF